MSNFMTKARHRRTGEVREILCLDDYFGQHKYGYIWEDKAMTECEFMEEYEMEGKEPYAGLPDDPMPPEPHDIGLAIDYAVGRFRGDEAMTIHNWLEKTKDVTLENTDKKAMLTMIKEARALMGVTEGVRPTKSAILNAICGYYSVGVIAVRDGRGKTTTLSEPRALCYYLMRELTDSSLIAIGEFMGGRDHACVIHGVKKIKKQLGTDEGMRRSVLLITQSLGVQAGSKPPFDFRGDNVNGPNF